MEVRSVPAGYAFMGDSGFYRVLSQDPKTKTARVMRSTNDIKVVSQFAVIRRLVPAEEFDGYLRSWRKRHGEKTAADINAEKERRARWWEKK